MKGVDLGWLSQVIDAAPDKPFVIKRPRDFRAISTKLVEYKPPMPANWFVNVCRKLLASELEPLDSSERVITASSQTIPSIKTLRQKFVAGKFGDAKIAAVLTSLNDRDAINLTIGEPLLYNEPILDVKVVQLDRGGGFYFDQCFAIRWNDAVAAIFTDGVGNRAHHRKFYGEDAQFAILPDDVELW